MNVKNAACDFPSSCDHKFGNRLYFAFMHQLILKWEAQTGNLSSVYPASRHDSRNRLQPIRGPDLDKLKRMDGWINQ